MEASGDRTNEDVELRVVHRTIWVIDLHDFWVLQNELVSDRSSWRKWTTRCFVGLMLTQNISTAYASGIRDWREHVRADQSPETFQRPNGRSTAAPAGEQFTLRIPARTLEKILD